MQQQLMEMFFRSDTHLLTKAEICDALWPKKEDAGETLVKQIATCQAIVRQMSGRLFAGFAISSYLCRKKQV